MIEYKYAYVTARRGEEISLELVSGGDIARLDLTPRQARDLAARLVKLADYVEFARPVIMSVAR